MELKFLTGIKQGETIEVIVTNQKIWDQDKFFIEGIIDNGIKYETASVWIYIKTLEIIKKYKTIAIKKPGNMEGVLLLVTKGFN